MHVLDPSLLRLDASSDYFAYGRVFLHFRRTPMEHSAMVQRLRLQSSALLTPGSVRDRRGTVRRAIAPVR